MSQIPQPYEPTYAPDEGKDIPVKITDPVEVRLLPAVSWNVNRFELSDTVGPVRVSSRNPYRKQLILLPETAGILFGTSSEQVRTRGGAGFVPLVGGPLVLTHTEEVWVNNVATESPKATVVEEMWPS